MDSFLKKIFDGKTDEFVHLQFQKFSKGNFKNKATIKALKTSRGYSISTTYEYANEIVRSVAEKIKGRVMINGAIISTRDLKDEWNFKDKKQFMGVKQHIIESEMTREELIRLLDKFSWCFFRIIFFNSRYGIKDKNKIP